MNSINQIFTRVQSDYLNSKSKKIMMVDSFILYTLATAAIQVQNNLAFEYQTRQQLKSLYLV